MATLDPPLLEAELKWAFVQKLDRVHDVAILSQAVRLLDEGDREVHELTPEEKRMFEKALAEDKWIPHEEVMENVREWLQERELEWAVAKKTETELTREAILQRLVGIDDPAVLDIILTLAKKYYKPKPLTPEQAEDIEIGRRQIDTGDWISHEEFMKELDEEFPDDAG